MISADDIYKIYDEVKDDIKNKNYSAAVEKSKKMIDMAEEEYKDKPGKWFSFNHLLETYFYVCFMKDSSPLQYTEYNISAFYRIYGFALMQLERYDKSKDAYISAIKWNPVDLDSYVQLAELYKHMKNPEECKKTTFGFYDYCCTRATMARFYRNIGYYYLEKYEPDKAVALYQYSNIFYHTDGADNELRFLEKALNKKFEQMDINQLQEILHQNEIPLGPNPDTLGIAFRVGQLEMDKENYECARDCFAMVYDLTQDAETKAYLEKIEEVTGNY